MKGSEFPCAFGVMRHLYQPRPGSVSERSATPCRCEPSLSCSTSPRSECVWCRRSSCWCRRSRNRDSPEERCSCGDHMTTFTMHDQRYWPLHKPPADVRRVSPRAVLKRVGDVVLIIDRTPPAGEDLHVGRSAVVNVRPWSIWNINDWLKISTMTK